MAVINFTTEYPVNHHGAILPGVMLVVWSNLANGDTGQPYVSPDKSEKSIQVSGTPGAGVSVTIQGSNGQAFQSTLSGGAAAGVAPGYAALNDPQGNALTFVAADVTANKIEEVLENPLVVRPSVTAGDGTTSITIRMLVRTQKNVS